MVETARNSGLKVTADVAAHQLFLTAEDVDGFNAQCHVVPPLRSPQDRDALREGVRRGVISAICSDHQPHDADAKINPFPLTEPGISGLETLLPLCLQLVADGVLSPLDMARRLSTGPAAIAGIQEGQLTGGHRANLTLIDPNAEYRIDPQAFVSAGKNTPFGGWTVPGRVVRTFHTGKPVYVAPVA